MKKKVPREKYLANLIKKENKLKLILNASPTKQLNMSLPIINKHLKGMLHRMGVLFARLLPLQNSVCKPASQPCNAVRSSPKSMTTCTLGECEHPQVHWCSVTF